MDFSVIWDSHGPQLLIAACLGALFGLERELSGKDPSLRTFALICLGSCIFSIVSVESVRGIAHGDPSRIAAQVVTGIGFLGAGTIFRSASGITGLTTATLIWVASAVGMAVGFGYVELGVTATIVSISTMYILKLFHRLIHWANTKSLKNPPK